jgi:carboxylesterase
MKGAEPFSATGGPDGVLVLHGFTGNPSSMRGIAERVADAGFTVELPLLPGHGTSVEDMVPTRWEDWFAAAEEAYLDLAARTQRVVVAALSMGGTLACRLAISHPEICGLALVNPLVESPDPAFVGAVRDLLESGTETAPSIGSDIAMPETREETYDATPLAPALSLFDAAGELSAQLPEIRCPVLLLSSREDHVVAPTNGDRLVASVGGPIERVWLERSYHVATLDFDRDEIEDRITAFALSILSDSEQ